jgi:thiol-disulfide isomerase/thioredoxin
MTPIVSRTRSQAWLRTCVKRRGPVAAPVRRAHESRGSRPVRPAIRLVTPALGALLLLALGLLLSLPGVALAAPPAAADDAGLVRPERSALADTGADWRPAASDADIDRHFTAARALGRPVLLYWGASWCPPCNRLKSTLFNRAEFVELSRGFIAVHVDGDLPGAQKLGARFRVRGYPTLVLLAPDGAEITRLPGEGDPAQVMRTLRGALAGGRTAAAVLADARAGRALTPAEWRLLAFYSWETAAEDGESVVVTATDRPAVLAELAARATQAAAAAPGPRPDADTVNRLWLKALVAGDEARGVRVDAPLRQRVQWVLADPAQARRHADVLAFGGDDLVRVLAPAPGAERQAWTGRVDAALRRLQADPSLARADRLAALGTRVELARIDLPRQAVSASMPAALQRELAQAVAAFDRSAGDPHERQAVVTLAAHVLARAGDWAASDALLRANLERSHSGYYLMSQLGSNARRQGRHDEALQWYERAYGSSRGPATRLQWGASYLQALVELSPRDPARIEQAAVSILADAAADEAAFHERSGRSLQRVSRAVSRWAADGGHGEVLARLRERTAPLCRAQPAGSAPRSACEALFRQVPAVTTYLSRPSARSAS